MEQKKKEKDVLIVRDEKTGEISVVAGIDKDGNPKRTPAKAEKAQDFLQFDRHGDVLDNFFKNFVRQCKEPSRFGFYRVAADQAKHLIGVMKELLKNPEANKELLAPHKVDISEYENKVKEEQANSVEPQNKEEVKKENEEKQEQAQTEGKRKGYQPIDESKINWQQLEERWGIRRDDLEKSGDLEKMLNYGKSNLVTVTPTFGDEKFETAARLSFKPQEDGSVRLVPHLIQKEANLKEEFKGYKFSAEDARNLRETGNMGRVADLVDKSTGEIIPSYVSIDRQTNEITSIPVNRIKWKDTIVNTKLSQPENVLRSITEAEGKYLTADVYAGDYIVAEKVAEEPAAENKYLYNLNGEKQAISITISSFAEGLSGKLKSGDIVSVIAPDYLGSGETVIPAELKYVEVIAVTAKSGYDANTQEQEEEKELPSTVTVLVRPEQSRLLARLEAEGEIHLSLVYRGDSQKAAQFIEAQDLVLEELLEETTEEEEVSVVKNEVPRTGGEADAVTAEETSADEKNDTDMEE